LPFVDVPMYGMLPMLGNLCTVIADEGIGDWNEEFGMDVEGSSLVEVSSCPFSAIASMACSPDDVGVGIKNFALAAAGGLTDGTEGDWNKFAGLPPPWLKVSTYLPKAHEYLPRLIWLLGIWRKGNELSNRV
jgi:hypothetical protein